jgi:putative transposase
MPDYRRNYVLGGSFFFTVNLLERHPNDLLTKHIVLLREALRLVRTDYPLQIDAWVVLPDHMHCVWSLPPGDADYTLRWRLIKAAFSKRLPKTERRSRVRVARGERGIWQRRFWEHTLRDERDYAAHVDYVHFNLDPAVGRARVCVCRVGWLGASLSSGVTRGRAQGQPLQRGATTPDRSADVQSGA